MTGAGDRPAAAERAGWLTLALLLAALTLTAAVADRTRWSTLLGDEATYLMAAESLAWDLDLVYERSDFERFQAHWGRPPEGLILQSGDGGATLVYGKPFFYPLFLAPFVRWSPTHGPFVANALLLAAAGWLAAAALRRRVGAAAPWWMAALLFASVAFTYVYWAHADLFLACLTALGLTLLFSDRPGAVRWAVAGALLCAVAFSRPLYAPLLAAAALAPAPRGRVRAVAALAAGALLLAGVGVAVHQATAGAWTAYGAERGGFYTSTGFPDVDFHPAEWQEALGRAGNMAWGGWIVGDAGPQWVRTGTSNLLYLLVGRHVGLLPYFLPLLLPLLSGPRGAARWALLAAVAVSLGAVLVLRPFNFYGGGAAIANRYFLPLYPALWFVASRPRRALWAGLATLAAAPFLWHLWLQGPSDPRRADNTWRYPTAVAERWLPYETTQSHLKPSGQEDIIHNGLWLKPLSRSLRIVDRRRLALLPGTTGEVLVGRERPLATLGLQVLSPAGSRLEIVAGARVTPTGDSDLYLLDPGEPTGSHSMWWTSDPFYTYRLRFRFEGSQEPTLFLLRPAATAFDLW
ncbi:MAG: hypothetical protein R3325_11560 [Thermoanaerobaculia bacterium]|nr:hypothetical protein [Thermoanaerobaculia bacterium]